MGLPIPAVKIRDTDMLDRLGIQASRVDADSIRIGARNIKSLDPAGRAEVVLRNAGVEGVGR